MQKVRAPNGRYRGMLRVSDVQLYCNVSRAKAYDMLGEGLPHVRIGKAIRVRLSDLEAFLKAHEVTT